MTEQAIFGALLLTLNGAVSPVKLKKVNAGFPTVVRSAAQETTQLSVDIVFLDSQTISLKEIRPTEQALSGVLSLTHNGAVFPVKLKKVNAGFRMVVRSAALKILTMS